MQNKCVFDCGVRKNVCVPTQKYTGVYAKICCQRAPCSGFALIISRAYLALFIDAENYAFFQNT